LRYTALILLMLILTFSTVLLSSCQSDESSHTALTTDLPSSTSTTEVESSISDPTASKAPPMLSCEEGTVPELGFIQVNSSSYISGTLLQIDDNHPYRYNVSTLQPSQKIKDHVMNITGQNLVRLYGNTAQKYLLKSAKLFYKNDAFSYLDGMLSKFSEDSGRSNIQIVNAYLYSDPSTLTNEYVTGYCVALNIFDNDVTYSITASEFDFQYQGQTISCLDWFIENCIYYGFVYTGLSGTQQQTLATFRFVGIPHAIAMTQNNITDVKVYNDTIKFAENMVVINDDYSDTIWYVTYVKAHESNVNTIIELPARAKYIISGDNVGGFIVAYKLS